MNMKKFTLLVLPISLIIGAVLAAGCAAEEIEAPSRIIADVTPQEAYTLIQDNQDNPDFVIIDVRTPEEFADGHLADALNIDFYSETFRDEINKLDKDRNYLIYCRSGGRSGKSLQLMAELNFKEVYNVLGGILAWNAEGLPTTK